ncbi:hybrid signal transduction histidine kinase M [Tanacetum coccineum]
MSGQPFLINHRRISDSSSLIDWIEELGCLPIVIVCSIRWKISINILGSLCDSLQEQVVTTPGNAKALWDHLKNLFHDNKDARAINLENELRSINIGKMTVNEYCTKIQAMANRLKNLDCDVSEKNMVIFAVDDLDSHFETLAEIICHREPLPTFETVRNMLLLKESSFNDDSTSTTFESSSSSPTILMVSSSSDTKGDLYPVIKPSTLPADFVSTSPTTWHQRLGHPGDEVLRSLNSRHLISCNKEKSTHVCHACQLGKHVKLPFHSSNSLVKQCFDIIHSDLWTSPIVSSSGFKYNVLFLVHVPHYV